MEQQLTLFGEEDIPQPPRPKAKQGGSNNSIVFHDYESFVAKFHLNPKTTDDCYTPKDVYEAVVKYVGTVIDMSDKVILRPFFPGGDYEHCDYPDNGVVIDNPPFSIFTKIVAFYSMHKIPFFLFGPGMTITSCCKYCTAVIADNSMIFENGANVRINYASNLFGDLAVITAPLLHDLVSQCPSQNRKVGLQQFRYPTETLRVSELHTICSGGIEFKLRRDEVVLAKKLDNKGGTFGDIFLISPERGAEKEAARLRAQEAAKQAIQIELSPRERRIVERLNGQR